MRSSLHAWFLIVRFFYKGVSLQFSSGQKPEKLGTFRCPLCTLQVNSGSGIGVTAFESQSHHILF